MKRLNPQIKSAHNRYRDQTIGIMSADELPSLIALSRSDLTSSSGSFNQSVLFYSFVNLNNQYYYTHLSI